MEKQVDPKVSKMMSEFSKRRKNPYSAFKDKSFASEAGKLGALKRWGNAKKKEA